MGKDGGFLTAKAISKRIKAKGLGRLRWYCQMCEKQCRDENGFKNHTQSAGHQRQLTLFAENSSEYITRFSNEFRKEFLSILRQRYGTSFVSANTVYQDHIKDKDHVHMNATKWTTLSGFVKELGKQGYCKVEERPDGFWVSYLDREAAERNRRAREMDKQRLESEERNERELQKRLEQARKLAHVLRDHEEPQTANIADVGPLSVDITLQERVDTGTVAKSNVLAALGGLKDPSSTNNNGPPKRRRSRWGDAPKESTYDDNVRCGKDKVGVSASEEQHPRPSDSQNNYLDAQENSDYAWIRQHIVVKVTNKTLSGGTFYGKKGQVIDVIDEFGARVCMNDTNAVLELDQDDLETVIPKPGGSVLLLRGPHRGSKATVKSIDVDKFSVGLVLLGSGEELQGIDYEAVSRLA